MRLQKSEENLEPQVETSQVQTSIARKLRLPS